MSQYPYLGEAQGGRILRYAGHATLQVTPTGTEEALLLAESWDITPAGESGSCVIRMVLVTVKFNNGFVLRITPSVDGVLAAPQTFTRQGSGIYVCEAWTALRGARASVLIEQLTPRTGDLEILQAKAAGTTIREVP